MPTETRASRAIDALTAEYNAWNEKEGLNLGSADEHLFDPSLTEEQRVWLGDFVQRWEDAEKFDRSAPAVWIEGPFGHAYYIRDGVMWAAPMYATATPVPFDMDEGVQTPVDEFAKPLSADQRAAVDVALKIAALAPGKRVSILSCEEYSWEPERDRCAAWLVLVDAPDGTAIFDPYASECGRFTVDPATEYGIPLAAAHLMKQHNQPSS